MTVTLDIQVEDYSFGDKTEKNEIITDPVFPSAIDSHTDRQLYILKMGDLQIMAPTKMKSGRILSEL